MGNWFETCGGFGKRTPKENHRDITQRLPSRSATNDTRCNDVALTINSEPNHLLPSHSDIAGQLTAKTDPNTSQYDMSPARQDTLDTELSPPVESETTRDRCQSASLTSPAPPLHRPPSVLKRQRSLHNVFRPDLVRVYEDVFDWVADGLDAKQMTLRLGIKESDREFDNYFQEMKSLSQEPDNGMNPSNKYWTLSRSNSSTAPSRSEKSESESPKTPTVPTPEWLTEEFHIQPSYYEDNEPDKNIEDESNENIEDESDENIQDEPDEIHHENTTNPPRDSLHVVVDIVDPKPAKSNLSGNAAEFKTNIQQKLIGDLIEYNDTIHFLSIETKNENCCNAQNGNEHTFDVIRENCPCFKRIHTVMEAYHKLLHDNELWNSITLQQVIISDDYGHQQLADDYLHCLSIHIEADDAEIRQLELKGQEVRQSIGQQMSIYFMNELPCGIGPHGMTECRAFQRHCRPRQPSPVDVREIRNRPSTQIDGHGHRVQFRRLYRTTEAKDIVFQDECDKIHSYFLQFGVYENGARLLDK